MNRLGLIISLHVLLKSVYEWAIFCYDVISKNSIIFQKIELKMSKADLGQFDSSLCALCSVMQVRFWVFH